MSRLLPCLLEAAALAVALGVWGQEAPLQVDISARELLGGAADSRLRELGARAADADLAVTVAAPAYWRDRIVPALEAGAGEVELEITYRETIVESVLVRLSFKRESPIASDPAPAATTQMGPAPAAPLADTSELDRAAARLREEAREMVVSEADFPSTAELLAGSTRSGLGPSAGVTNGDPPEAQPPTADPSVDRVPDPARSSSGEDQPDAGDLERAAPAPTVESAEVADPAAPDPRAADRASLSRRLNDGRAIERRLSVARLHPRDWLFTSGDVIAVVRRTVVGRDVYLLDGDLDLAQSGLRQRGPGSYEVLKRLPEPAAAAPAVSDSVTSAARRAMEMRYNRGRAVEATVTAVDLRPDDVLLVGDGEIMVVRRRLTGLKRFWLDGPVDLEREELESTGTDQYRVRREIRD